MKSKTSFEDMSLYASEYVIGQKSHYTSCVCGRRKKEIQVDRAIKGA